VGLKKCTVQTLLLYSLNLKFCTVKRYKLYVNFTFASASGGLLSLDPTGGLPSPGPTPPREPLHCENPGYAYGCPILDSVKEELPRNCSEALYHLPFHFNCALLTCLLTLASVPRRAIPFQFILVSSFFSLDPARESKDN